MIAQTKDSTGRTLDDRLAELADVVRKEWMDAIGPALESARREGRDQERRRLAGILAYADHARFCIAFTKPHECDCGYREALVGKGADDADK